MDADKAKAIALTAAMEGEQVVARNIGSQVTLSEMELIVLVNFAEIGVLSLFSDLEGGAGKDSKQMLQEHLAAIRAEFTSDRADGLDKLNGTCVALLRSERFMKYLVSTDFGDDVEAGDRHG
jgi:hypothetical protein